MSALLINNYFTFYDWTILMNYMMAITLFSEYMLFITYLIEC